MVYTGLILAIFAFSILLAGAALLIYVENDVPSYPDDYPDESEPCEDGECNALGDYKECTKCGYIDYLAQYHSSSEVK